MVTKRRQFFNLFWCVIFSHLYDVPQDVQWNDIDYMDAYRDFTYDQTRFKNYAEMVKEFHEQGRKYIMIVVRNDDRIQM